MRGVQIGCDSEMGVIIHTVGSGGIVRDEETYRYSQPRLVGYDIVQGIARDASPTCARGAGVPLRTRTSIE